jgi:hypothetical protein
MSKKDEKHPTLETAEDIVMKKVHNIQIKLERTSKKLLKGEELGEMAKSIRVVINMVIELYHDDVYNKDKTFQVLDDLLFIYDALDDKLVKVLKDYDSKTKELEKTGGK